MYTGVPIANPLSVSRLSVPASARAIPKSASKRVAIGGEQQVLGLNVPVDDPMVMGVLQGLRGFPNDPERILHRQPSRPPQPVAERLPDLVKQSCRPDVASVVPRSGGVFKPSIILLAAVLPRAIDSTSYRVRERCRVRLDGRDQGCPKG